MSKNQNTVLMWCDLETTGLKPVKNHRILEYAVVFTDLELNELGSCGGVISQDLEIVQALMDDYVINMHTQNGLLKDLADLEQYTAGYSTSLLEAQERILKTLHDVKNKVTDYQVEVIFVIAGNTVGFDKGYIEYHMPRLFDRLHYRQLDVSSYKVGFPETFGTATSDAHRAMADIRDSIEQHRKMRGLVADGLLAEKAFDGVGKFIMDSKSHDD